MIMKNLRLVSVMIIVYLSFVCISCTSEEEISSVTVEKQELSAKDAEEYAKLINYMEQIDPIYNITNEKVLTRGRWVRWWAVLKMDAMGYTWGREHGLSWQVSLACAAAVSIVAVIVGSKKNTMSSWNINPNWIIYNPINEYEKIGYEHNRLVQQIISKHPAIRTGNVSIPSILSYTEKSLSSIGYSGTITNLYRTEFLVILNSDSFDVLEAKMERATQNNQSAFLESYVQRIAQITDKSMVHSYTQTILKEIDNLSISDKATVKSMVCICENSRFLWVGLE